MPKRNDSCWCGSNIKYKKCHLNSDNTKPNQKLKQEHKNYIRKWKENAKAFDLQKCYIWMAEKIFTTQKDLILDIGCGDGTGIETLLLVNKNPELKIISIDENLDCLKEAKINLESKGYSVELIERCKVIHDDKYYKYEFSPITQTLDKQITLIQSDLLSDIHLEKYLKSIGEFDAVTIWLIGTHIERQNCMNIFPLNITADYQYRIHVQNKAYELSNEILKSGGILQTVDRGEAPISEELKQIVMDGHKDQASVTTLDVYDIDYIFYTEPVNKNSIQMKASVGGKIADLPKMAMTSILSKK